MLFYDIMDSLPILRLPAQPDNRGRGRDGVQQRVRCRELAFDEEVEGEDIAKLSLLYLKIHYFHSGVACAKYRAQIFRFLQSFYKADYSYSKRLYISNCDNIITKSDIMKLELKIVDLLARNAEKRFVINEIAEALGEYYSFVHRTVGRLSKEGVIKKEKAGKSFLCSLNLENEKTLALIKLGEIEKKEEFYNANK
ncbi:MAG: hypothetical protein WA063_03505, partial [Minisyncoccia bacterium]